MNLELKKPLLFFDIESTGLSIVEDSIIELSFVKILPVTGDAAENPKRIRTWRIRPWNYTRNCQKPITQGAKDVTGITDEELTECPKFYEVLPEVVSWLKDTEEGGEGKGCDLAGFNSNKFDLPLLAEEIERARNYLSATRKNLSADSDINLHQYTMVDVQTIYHYMEPRNLRAAYRFYCGGKDFENAHSAEADTVATYEVLKSQIERYQKPDPENADRPLLKNDVAFLAGIGNLHSRFIDYAGRLVYDDNGDAVINFGKHKGKQAREIFRTEPSYFSWILSGDFTADTKRQFQILAQQYRDEMSKPLSGKQFEDATEELRRKFGLL